MKTKMLSALTVLGSALLFASAALAGPGSFSYEGRIYDAGGNPATGSATFTLRILNPTETCVIYEEVSDPADLTATNGYFSVSVGKGTPTALFTARPLTTVFSNLAPSISGSGGCLYNPALSDGRKLQVVVNQNGTAITMNPSIEIGTTPYAVAAEDSNSLGGKSPSSFLQLGAGSLTQANADNVFSSSNYTKLVNLLAGQLPSASNGASSIPGLGSAPATPTGGQIWFDTGSHQMKFYDGTSTQTFSAGASGVSSLAAGTGMAVSASTGAVTVSLSAAGVTSTELASGSVTGAKIASGVITSGHLAGNISITTTGNLQATNLSSNTDSTKQLLLYSPASGATQKITVTAPTLAGDLNLTLPSTAGAAGNVLTTDGTGVLSWQAAGAGSQWTTSGPNVFFNTGNVGVGTSTPATKLDVSGAIRIGMDASSCAGAVAGAIRYNSGVVEFCNGSAWTAFSAGGAGLANLNGLTTSSQSFSTPGTGGTAPAWTSTGSVHTLNIPLASTASVTAGLLSNTDYTSFSGKLGSALTAGNIYVGNGSNVATAVAASGDVTLAPSGAFSVTKLSGVALSGTFPSAAGQVYRYDGTSTWTPGFLSLADIHSTVTVGNTIFPVTPCTSDKSLTWTSLTDTFTCQSISISDSQVTYAGRAANLVLAGPTTGGSAAPTFRALTLSDLPAGIATQWTTSAGNLTYTGGAGIGTSSVTTGAVAEFYGTGVTNSAILLPRGTTSLRPTAGVNGMFRYNTVSNAFEGYVNGAWQTVSTGAGGSYLPLSGGALTGALAAAAGSSAAPSLAFSSDSTTGIYTSGAGNISLATSGVQRIAVNSSGSVGFGTSAPLTGVIADFSGSGPAQSAIALPRDSSANRPSGGNGMVRYNTTSNKFEGYENGAWVNLIGAGGGSQWTTNGSNIYYTTGLVGIGTTLPGVSLDAGFNTDAIRFPNGTLAQRPTGQLGLMRYNTTNNAFEGYLGGGWQSFATGAGGAYLPLAGGTLTGALNMGGSNIQGSSSASGNLTLESTSSATKGNIILAGNGGSVGVGTIAPAAGAVADFYANGSGGSAIVVPRDTTVNRPASPVNGMVRYNTTLQKFESYENGAWISYASTAALAAAGANGTAGAMQFAGTGGSFASDVTNLAWDATNKRLGVGTAAPAYTLDVEHTITGSTQDAGQVVNVNFNPSASSVNSDASYIEIDNNSTTVSSAGINAIEAKAKNVVTGNLNSVYGALVSAYNMAGGTVTNSTGISGQVYNSSTGSITNATGATVSALNNGTGTIATAIGSWAQATNQGSGTITTAYGSRNAVQNTGAGSTITNAYGNYATVQNSSGSIAAAYGVYIDTIQGTNTWGLYQSDVTAKNYFAGNVGFGTTAPTARLQVAAGTTTVAPLQISSSAGALLATPMDGVIEYDGSKLYMTVGSQRRDFVLEGGSGTPINLNPGAGNSVNIGGGGSSTTATTGAMIVNGGVGISENLNVGGNVGIGTATAATGAVNSASGSMAFTSSVWNGGSAINDSWMIRNVPGPGANPESILDFSHSGSMGPQTVQIHATDADATLRIASTNGAIKHNPSLQVMNYMPGTVGIGTASYPRAALTNVHGTAGTSLTGPVTQGEWLGSIEMQGSDSASTLTGGAEIHAVADQNWTTTSHPTSLLINLMGTGSNSYVDKVTINSQGILVKNYDNNPFAPSTLTLAHARGLVNSPVPTQAGDVLAEISGAGYDTTSSFYPGAKMSVMARENWTSTAHGSALQFLTAKVGTTNPIPSMVIENNGSVGIGVGTASPSANLEVQGTDINTKVQIRNLNSTIARNPGLDVINYMGSANTGAPSLAFTNARGNPGSMAAANAGDELGEISFSAASATASVNSGARIVGFAEAATWSGTSTPAGLAFLTTPVSSATGIERMRITNSGSVGIGTALPSDALHIFGAAATNLRLQVTGGSMPAELLFVRAANTSRIGQTTSSGFEIMNAEASNLTFGTNNLTKMTLMPSGNFGIGTTIPGATLDVAGHTANSGSPVTLGACGTGPSFNGNDTRGTVTIGTGAPTSCALTFNTAYNTSPFCVVSWTGATVPTSGITSVSTTTGLTVSFAASGTGTQFTYHCMQ